MASRIPPVAKTVFVCDEIAALAEDNPGKISILNVFDSVFLSTDGPPYTLGKLCVFSALTGLVRDYAVQVVVVNARTGQTAFTSRVHTARINSRLSVTNVLFRLLDCPFPEEGVYLVELHCDGEFVDDRRLTVTPINHSED